MRSKQRRPMWIILYLIIGGFLGAVVWVINAPVSETEQTIVELGLAGIFWWLINGWINENEVAMMMADMEKKKAQQERRYPGTSGAVERPRKPFPSSIVQDASAWLAALAATLGHLFRSS